VLIATPVGELQPWRVASFMTILSSSKTQVNGVMKTSPKIHGLLISRHEVVVAWIPNVRLLPLQSPVLRYAEAGILAFTYVTDVVDAFTMGTTISGKLEIIESLTETHERSLSNRVFSFEHDETHWAFSWVLIALTILFGSTHSVVPESMTA
jgi:hypothetical protein